MRKVVIGCDNAAVDLKNEIIKHLGTLGVEVENIGCNSAEDPTYYPLIAEKVCNKIIESGYEKRGILICGTGIGMAMAANKFKGIRAAVCHDIFSTERSILSNNGNIMCMGERVIGKELAKRLVSEWIKLEFVDGSSTPKIKAICNIEDSTMK
ncbi:ribose 5-phosphate isomerase B [Clostridium magnum]|uniref:Putative sugar phosphate isomerase YwlF n=1 Tax=Clostridium magnum DSM 2767 TaxID=1121326 RepID=A0A161YFW0_9CLOT|nr:ribose 5-phosphate isomerase B [Clostridium magnum]KZL88992.1 putative sugar phosphate isomerase YwlF [Clostridium magnum DSM 2767]SHI23436.1 ribose 5-phosphate isomerase B [Clostridium magnum DSM 2767]